MSKINVLDSSIYNLISAGEVVERPSSVVKELVENAIDAGAKNIKIDIIDGGKTKITVSDDGSGIEAEYIKTAFLPHSTSKIFNASDLESIATLGFRGEALASIASVSMVTMVSKTKNSVTATQIELKGGNIETIQETSGLTGTVITVENLFYNTPARIKFLKKNKSEETQITTLITNMILAKPDIAFIYTADNKTIYQTMGDGLKNTVYSVYNREITMNLVEIENTFKKFSISGYISKPTFFKGNRSWQTLIINGRLVENRTIITAVEKAYERFLMKRAYPLYILNITMPLDFLDVNVHPNKTDVRFQDNNEVFSFVYHSILNVLENFSDVKIAPNIEYVDDLLNNSQCQIEDKNISENPEIVESSPIFDTKHNSETNFNSFDSKIFSEQSFRFPQSNVSKLRSDSGISYDIIKNRVNNIELNNSFIDDKPEIIDFNCKIVGQLFDTYIIIEKQDEVYFIDQHAAHERILYDELLKDEESFLQPLLIPYIVETNHTEYDFLNDCIAELNDIGFDIHPFGRLSFKVSAVPGALTGIDLNKFFTDVLNDLSHTTSFKSNDILKEKLMQIACKNAVKAGDSLNNWQIEILIKMFNENGKVPLQCPHGRPAVVKISKNEIEKWFKRIV